MHSATFFASAACTFATTPPRCRQLGSFQLSHATVIPARAGILLSHHTARRRHCGSNCWATSLSQRTPCLPATLRDPPCLPPFTKPGRDPCQPLSSTKPASFVHQECRRLPPVEHIPIAQQYFASPGGCRPRRSPRATAATILASKATLEACSRNRLATPPGLTAGCHWPIKEGAAPRPGGGAKEDRD